MEYLKKCQKCEYLKTVSCYGTRKGTRSVRCPKRAMEARRKWVENLPVEGRVSGAA